MRVKPILGWILGNEHKPGSNIRGTPSGATWTFLLPSLDLGTVVCLGAPTQATQSTLARLAQTVTIVCAGRPPRLSPDHDEPGNVVHASRAETLLAGAADLVAINGQATRDRIATARQLVAPDGLVFRETRGWDLGAAGRRSPLAGVSQAYWLTPIVGEATTAIPLGHRAARHHFIAAGLESAAFNVNTLASLRHRRQPQAIGAPSSAAEIGPSHRHNQQKKLRRLVHQAIFSSVDRLAAAERLAGRRVRPFRRLGVIEGGTDRLVEMTPPRYLIEIAAANDVDISRMEWSLCASGAYETQKVLFYLFAPEDRRPRYVVKLARSHPVSPRLENAHSGLQAVAALPAAVASMVPSAAFHGRHQQLAIVAESAVDGMPFDARSTSRPDCRLAGKVIDWLILLGQHSARPVDTAAVGDALDGLRSRLTSIYALSAEEDGVLMRMADEVRSASSFPTVLQHGDPGIWNLIATADGGVRVLDWENAEMSGLPLADLIEFLRSFSVLVSGARTVDERTHASLRPWITDDRVAAVTRSAIHRYVMEVQIAPRLIEALLLYAFVYQAVKEAPRLLPDTAGSGFYVSILRRLLRQRTAAAFRQLVRMA